MENTIQELAEMIYHHKTKKYFDEVLNSFENENYRSSVVTTGSYYNQPYIETHWLTKDDVAFFNQLAKEKGIVNEFYDLMISHYYHTGSYNGADISFERCIRPFYEEFNKEQFETLLSETNYNPQCYDGKYGSRNKILLEVAKKVMPDIDLEGTYTNIF